MLLVGEKGAGHELCARFLHAPETPWEHLEEPGPLATEPLELAERVRGGVLFVPETDSLGRLEQKGLHLLVGKAERYNLRVVCGATPAVHGLHEQGRFDAALYQVLAGIVLEVPALREHAEDVPDLAKAMLEHWVEAKVCPPRSFSTAALNALRQAEWPGNLPQLENAVKTLALTALAEEIAAEDVERLLRQHKAQVEAEAPPPALDLPLDQPLREAREAFERLYFEHHIAKAGGNMSRVAENVGLERTHLYRKLKQLDIRFSRRGED